MRLKTVKLISALLCLTLLAGCGNAVSQTEQGELTETGYVDAVELAIEELEDEAVALSEVPAAALPDILVAEASGVLVKKNGKAVIDYSNTEDGYVMVQFTADTSKRLKVQVQGPTTTYTYNLNKGAWTVFPLTDGNGKYQIKVFENVSGTKYSMVTSVTQEVALADEFAPFLRPNQYVDYSVSSKTVAKAKELTKELTDPLKKVAVIYDFVIKNLTYDKEKAATDTSGYLPVLDTELEAKKGICYDYAALMAGMLRSQGNPCKLVIGYAGTAHHAWINVWTADTGWVDGIIYFNGTTWQRMDPTFASTGKQSQAVMAYIGDGKNYTTKYLY